MIRTCEVCQAKARKAPCCDRRLCDACLDTHTHPDLLAAASDPKLRAAWRAANAPEERLTTEVVAALNKLSGVEAWQARKRGGFRANDPATSVPDVIGYAAPGGIFIGVETKRACKDGCPCESCTGQRAWGARLIAAGGVYVSNARTVQQAVDGVRMWLAHARARTEAA